MPDTQFCQLEKEKRTRNLRVLNEMNTPLLCVCLNISITNNKDWTAIEEREKMKVESSS